MSKQNHKPKPVSSSNQGTIAFGIIAVLIFAFGAYQFFGKSTSQNELPTPQSELITPQPTAQQESIPEQQPAAEIKQYAEVPAITIDPAKQYLATFVMANGGTFVVQLYAEKAPITVNSFVFLARDGFFDGITFHRVLDGFMAQGGDPTGTGMGGPGYQFINEDSDLTFDKAGVVAMANAGRDTNGSQFFITFAPAEFLNGGYTIFGQVVEGMDVVNAITRRDPDTFPSFLGDAIQSVTISEN